MRIAVHVRPGASRDGLWRDGDGLYAQIRALPIDGEANTYLVKYLSGCLRVAKSLVTITKGHNSSRKTVDIATSEADLRPMIESLGPKPQASLFDGQ